MLGGSNFLFLTLLQRRAQHILKAAKQVGLTVPPWLLLRAETVIKRA
jgi:hypothetical protein